MAILRYELGPMDNNSFLIVDAASGDAAIVDPSFDSEAIWPEIEAHNYNVRYILNTHAHFDHIVQNAFFAEKTDAPIALHRADLELLHLAPAQARLFGMEVAPSPEPTIFLEDQQTLMLGETKIKVLFTPGHSPGGVTFLVEDAALAGDCLFWDSIGRTDLPGGSQQTLLHSIRTQLLTLPDETQVLTGHGDLTTIGRERNSNPYLR